jgi:hypothetical protein
MQAKFDIAGVEKAITARVEAALELIGGAGVGFASDQWRANGYSPNTPKDKQTSNLVNSITWSTESFQGPMQGQTDGEAIAMPDRKLSVRIGSNVVYARRVELGFSGKDSKGRTFNQPPKSYLRAGLFAKREVIKAIFQKAIHG